MLAPCEIAVKCALPAVRAMIAKRLVTKHNLKQAEAAELLGVSQPAISLYSRKIRGKAIDLERDQDVKILVERLANTIAEKNLPRKEFIVKFCEICRTIRAKGLLCKTHKNFEPSIEIKDCELCSAMNAVKCL
jgi:predicted transcriptional regulator